MWEGGREWHNNGQGKEEEEGLTWPTARPPGPSPDVWVSRPTLPSPKPRTRTPSRTSPKPPTAKCRVRKNKIYDSWITLDIAPQIFCRSLPNTYYLIFVIFFTHPQYEASKLFTWKCVRFATKVVLRQNCVQKFYPKCQILHTLCVKQLFLHSN